MCVLKVWRAQFCKKNCNKLIVRLPKNSFEMKFYLWQEKIVFKHMIPYSGCRLFKPMILNSLFKCDTQWNGYLVIGAISTNANFYSILYFNCIKVVGILTWQKHFIKE